MYCITVLTFLMTYMYMYSILTVSGSNITHYTIVNGTVYDTL